MQAFIQEDGDKHFPVSRLFVERKRQHNPVDTYQEPINDEEVLTMSFQKPLFQTFGMFVGMLFGLVMHWIVLIFRIPFPGYDFGSDNDVDGDNTKDVELRSEKTTLLGDSRRGSAIDGENNGVTAASSAMATKTIPVWMYFFLAIPAIFDLAATALW